MTLNYNGTTLETAKKLDKQDPLKEYRDQFYHPLHEEKPCLYFAGHSLGLRPKNALEYIQNEFEDWKKYGVEGHFNGDHPWLPYHEFLAPGLAHIAGAKESEVVAMNTLTVNLHLMLISFYRPTKTKFKILIENNTFPSDKYAVDSQARLHGFDPKEAIIQLEPEEGEYSVSEDRIKEIIEREGDQLALIMLGNCNYLSGQCFDMEEITKLGHSYDAFVGFNLAHGAGNLHLELNKWNVDFAVWCSYKYLNSGPGGIAAAFVHEKHHGLKDLPRLEGWWGHNKETRFQMGPNFDPINTAEAWQLSNPPIFQLASLRASLEIFQKATMTKLIEKRNLLTGYLEYLLNTQCGDKLKIMTPSWDEQKQMRGAMLSVRMKGNPKKLVDTFQEKGVVVDFREPDILRMAPIPLYTKYEDAFNLVQIIDQTLE